MKKNEHITGLKDQIESLEGEIFYLSHESRENSVLTKCKYIAFTTGDMEFHNINKGNNNKHSKNENNSNKYIIENLRNDYISNYNTNDSTEYTKSDNNTSISNVKSNSNVISATSNNNSTHDFNYDTQNK